MSHYQRCAAVVVSLGLIASACGSNGSDSEAAPPDSVAAITTTTTAAPTTTEADVEPETTTTLPVFTSNYGPLDNAPELRDRECEGDAPQNATCHWITVPSDWAEEGSSPIELPLVVLAAQGSTVQPDPIVAPSGGPGFSGSQHYFWSTYPQNQARDIIVYDQRGTGVSTPSLECPELEAVEVLNFQRVEPFEVELASVEEAADQCRQRLEAAGVDLNDYDSEANARDLDAIRRALGYDEWNILGVSYGARLALVAMRTTPAGIRTVILDSIADVTYGGLAANADSGARALEILATACEQDEDCTEKYGDLSAAVLRIQERYNEEPGLIQLDLKDGNGPQDFYVTGNDIMGGLHLALYNANYVALLPSLIVGFDNGNLGIAPLMLENALSRGSSVASAMEWSVDCADNAGVNQADAAFQADPGRFELIALEPSCDHWVVDPTSADFNDPILSDIPTLVIAGMFDPVTPADASVAVAERMTIGYSGVWPNQSHRVSGTPCADRIEISFLEDPNSEPNMACLEATPAMEFS